MHAGRASRELAPDKQWHAMRCACDLEMLRHTGMHHALLDGADGVLVIQYSMLPCWPCPARPASPAPCRALACWATRPPHLIQQSSCDAPSVTLTGWSWRTSDARDEQCTVSQCYACQLPTTHPKASHSQCARCNTAGYPRYLLLLTIQLQCTKLLAATMAAVQTEAHTHACEVQPQTVQQHAVQQHALCVCTTCTVCYAGVLLQA